MSIATLIVFTLVAISIGCAVAVGILIYYDYKSGKLDNFEHPEI